MSASNAPGIPPGWRERAAERSVADARNRAVESAERFVEAARGLFFERIGTSFTVEEVAQRSGASLKTLYKHFRTKDDLLLALYESHLLLAAGELRQRLEPVSDPLERIRAFIAEILAYSSDERTALTAASTREHHRLAENYPRELRTALEPFIDILADCVRQANEAGLLENRDPRRDAVTIFHLVLSYVHGMILQTIEGHHSTIADSLWRFCLSGLGVRQDKKR